MSFDLFAQEFLDGEATPADPSTTRTILEVLHPHTIETEEPSFLRTRMSNGGEADFYVGPSGSGFMVNHFSPGETMDLIWRAAARGNLVVLGPGLPPMLTHAKQLEQLPEVLRSEPVPALCASGEELHRLIGDDEDTYRLCRERLLSAIG